MIQTNNQTEAMFQKYQHEALLIIRLDCRRQGGLKASEKECKEMPGCKKCSLKSVALAVKNY